MADSLKMAKLDCMTFKTQFLNGISIIIVLSIFGFQGSSMLLLGITASWFTALLMTNIFVIQEKNDLTRLYGSLAIRMQDIVKGRYIFIYVSYLLNLVLTVIMGVGFDLFHHRNLSLQEILESANISFLIFTIMACPSLPIFFRLGYMRAKGWFMLFYIAVLVLFLMFVKTEMLNPFIQFVNANRPACALICFAVSLMVILLTYHISIYCYRKRKY